MAKVRVYELARELNMDSKELVQKLTGGGMTVKNYMSTLDETAVVRAKEIASGVISEVIEEQRIKPTVIRRRKKIKRVESAIPAAEAEEKVEVVAPETPPEVGKVPESEVAVAEIPGEVETEPVTEAVPLGKGGPEERTLGEEISAPLEK